MSSYKQKKRRVLEVRKRTKKRLKSVVDGENMGLKRREGLYRSEGAKVRGSFSSSTFTTSFCPSGNHHVLCCNNEQTKLDLVVNEIKRIQQRYMCSVSKSNLRRRKAATIVFAKTKAVAKQLESRLGNPVTKKSTKQAKYARHSFKPKGQGRVGGRSSGPGDGITIASTYRTKHVAVLHARSSEKEEASICNDLRSGKLRYVIVAESGKIGCGDPLWDLRDYVGLVVLYDIQHQDASKISDIYDALSSYGGLGICGCKDNLFARSHRPHILSIVGNLNSDTTKNLISHLQKMSINNEKHEIFLPASFDGGVSNLRSRIFEFYMERNESKLEDTDVMNKIVSKCMDLSGDAVSTKKVESLFVALSKRYTITAAVSE